MVGIKSGRLAKVQCLVLALVVFTFGLIIIFWEDPGARLIAVWTVFGVYLLLGLIWASLYALVLLFEPQALKGIPIENSTVNFAHILYFSYVTLATLGYGDVTPVVPLTWTLAYLEAITGTFYLAIVVASLINARREK